MRNVEQGKAHAALVMDGDEAIAWAEYGTPVELPPSTTGSSTTPRRPRAYRPKGLKDCVMVKTVDPV